MIIWKISWKRETRVGDCGKKLGHPRVHIHTHRCDTEQAVYISYQFNFRSFRLRNFHLPILGIQSRSINIFIDFYSTLCFYWLLCYFDYLAPCTLNFKFIPLSPFKPPWHLTFVFQMHVYAIMYLVVAAIRVCLYVCGFYWISTQWEIFTK